MKLKKWNQKTALIVSIKDVFAFDLFGFEYIFFYMSLFTHPIHLNLFFFCLFCCIKQGFK